MPLSPQDKGVRIRVPDKYANKLIVVETIKPMPVPSPCKVPACNGEWHRFKTYHLRITSDSTTIVSQKIYRNLVESAQVGPGTKLEVVNGVANPPTQVYGQSTHVQNRPRLKVKKVI